MVIVVYFDELFYWFILSALFEFLLFLLMVFNMNLLGCLGKNSVFYFNYHHFVSYDLIAYKLLIYSVLSRIETFWVSTALAFCAADSMPLFSIPVTPLRYNLTRALRNCFPKKN